MSEQAKKPEDVTGFELAAWRQAMGGLAAYEAGAADLQIQLAGAPPGSDIIFWRNPQYQDKSTKAWQDLAMIRARHDDNFAAVLDYQDTDTISLPRNLFSAIRLLGSPRERGLHFQMATANHAAAENSGYAGGFSLPVGPAIAVGVRLPPPTSSENSETG